MCINNCVQVFRLLPIFGFENKKEKKKKNCNKCNLQRTYIFLKQTRIWFLVEFKNIYLQVIQYFNGASELNLEIIIFMEINFNFI